MTETAAGHDRGMGAWTPEELDRIQAAQELEIAPVRRDGTLRQPVPIWVVRAGDDLYVRAAYGEGSGWHRVARASGRARIRAGGVEKDVMVEEAQGAVVQYRLRLRQADPVIDGVALDGYLAGDDDQAKQDRQRACRLDRRPIDVGPLVMARDLEALVLLNIMLQVRNNWPWQAEQG
jgi:hypothetical protein